MDSPHSERQRHILPEQVAGEIAERFGTSRVKLEAMDAALSRTAAVRVTAFPENAAELGEMLAYASAERWRVIPAGRATWLEMGNPVVEAHLFLSTAKMTRILEYEPADLTATVEAGCTLSTFNSGSAAHRQFIPLDPFGDERQTLGAIVATGSFGTLRCGFGTPRDWVIGMRVARGDGTITKAGGKVVKNVAGYDLCKLYTGSYGTLGVICELSFKLRALPPGDRTIVCASDKLVDLCSLASRIVDSDLQPAAMEIFSPDAVGLSDLIPGQYVIALRFLDEQETIDSEEQHVGEMSGTLRCVTLAEDDANELWSAYRASETASRWVWSLRVSVLPTEVPAMVGEIQQLMPSSSVCIHAANGVIRVFDEAPSLEQLKTAQRPRKVAELRQVAQSRGGQLVILRAPDEILEKLDVWGDVGQTARLMRELKARFDPQATLNPGRFVAGI